MNNFNDIKRRGGRSSMREPFPIWEWAAVTAAAVVISLMIMDGLLP